MKLIATLDVNKWMSEASEEILKNRKRMPRKGWDTLKSIFDDKFAIKMTIIEFKNLKYVEK